MALITVTEATDVKPSGDDRKIIINSNEISRVEPANDGDIGKSSIYMRDGHFLQVHETPEQIKQLVQ